MVVHMSGAIKGRAFDCFNLAADSLYFLFLQQDHLLSHGAQASVSSFDVKQVEKQPGPVYFQFLGESV